MGTESIDWNSLAKDLGEVFSESLKPVLGDIWDQAKDDLVPLGKRAAKYLIAVTRGETGVKVALESVQRQARLIASRHLRDFEESVRAAFLNAVDVALSFGSKFLRLLLK